MTGISTLSQTTTQVQLIKSQQSIISDLSRQLSTGYKTDRFSGLGADSQVSQRARANLTSIEQYTKNTDSADFRLSLTITSIKEFKAQAENLSDAILSFGGQSSHQEGEVVYDANGVAIGKTSKDSDVEFQNLKDTASSVFLFLDNLINAKEGNRYLFSGDQTLEKPYNDNGTIDAALSGLLSDWKNGTISTQDLTASLSSKDASVVSGAITDATLGYSTSISSGSAGGVSFRPDEFVELDYTTLANDDGFRDVLVAASYIKSSSIGPIVDEVDADTLTVTTQGAPGDSIQEQQDNFYSVLQHVSSMIESALDKIDSTTAKLELMRGQIADIKGDHIADQGLLNELIGKIENADINEAAVRLNSVNTNLSVSYSVTALIQKTSLVNFI